MGRWINTKEQKWVEQWNKFLLSDESSSFVQSIYRVRAYEKYGMDWELLLYIDSGNNILAGSANIIIKFSFIKMYICSYGPTVNSNLKSNFDINEYIKVFKNRGKKLNAFVSQITVLMKLDVDESLNSYVGRIFTNIAAPRYNNLISLKSTNNWYSIEEIINTFLSKGRRDVRASFRKGLYCKFPLEESELREAYLCFENNAINKGYSVRSWIDMKEFVIDSVNNNMAFVITAWRENKIQGAIFLERSSNKLSYTMGGVYRNNPDLLTGYFLQIEAMRLALKLNIPLFDISFGGPVEVQRFKGLFNPTLTEDYKTIYFIHKPLIFFVYNKFYSAFKGIIPLIVSIKKWFHL